MNRSKTLEAMAIALYEHATGMKWSDGTGLTKGKMVEFAEVALTACESRLQAEGMAVVPIAEIQFARDAVEDWAGYADDYFKKRHDLAGDLARIEAMLAAHTQEKDA